MRLLKGLGIATVLFVGAQHVGAEEIRLQTNTVLNENGLSYVPTKIVTNQLNAPVSWNNQDKTLDITKNYTKISFKLGESSAKVNEEIVNSAPIVVKDGVSYLPLRFIAETLNMKVDWNADVITLTSYDQYIVKQGDYLYKISQKYGLSVEEIQKINNLKDDKIQVGQVLYLRPSLATSASSNQVYLQNDADVIFKETLDAVSTENIVLNDSNNDSNAKVNQDFITKTNFEYTSYIVQKGDYLSKISSENKISLKDLLAVNNLTESTIIRIGDELLLPKRIVPLSSKVSNQNGEYLDWWTEAQYLFPIGEIATVTDFETGISFLIRRSYGTNHADCEPLTAEDTAAAKELWGDFSWNTRAVLVEVEGRTIAASMSFMPHDIQSILDNDFEGHFDLHFRNSTRHKDGKIDNYHQEKIKVAAGVQ